jgi:hypothetical protein
MPPPLPEPASATAPDGMEELLKKTACSCIAAAGLYIHTFSVQLKSQGGGGGLSLITVGRIYGAKQWN